MTAAKRKLGAALRRATVVLLLIAAPNLGWGQTNEPAPLPPAAQQALDKGIIAAKVPDYPLAVRFFEEARKLAPQALVVFLNLGIAESKIPGRELRAIAWFGAYLAASPDALNAAAVKQQIAVLDVRTQSNLTRFLKTVQHAASQMQGDKKTESLARMAGLWAKAGDIAAALNAASLCGDSASGKSYAYSVVAEVHAMGGDITGAWKTADMIPRKTEEIRRDLSYLARAHIAIAEAQTRAGDFAGAQKTFDLVQRNAKLIPAFNRSDTLRALAEAQARSGDFAGAQKTVDLMPDDVYKKIARDSVATYAKSHAANTPPSQSKSRSAVKASDWLTRLDDTHPAAFLEGANDTVPLGHALIMDMPGYLKALPASYKTPAERMNYRFERPAEDQRVFDALRETAERLIHAQNVVSRMLKAQL